MKNFFARLSIVFMCIFLPMTVIALPTGYTQLEYIESTGTQWIDLGQRIGSSENITARFAYTDSSSRAEWFGARDGTDWRSPKFAFSYPSADPLQFMVYSTSNNNLQAQYYTAQQPCVIGTIYTLHWYGNPLKVPTLSPEITFGNSGITQSNYLYTPNRNAYLFTSHPSNIDSPSSSRKMRIYEFQVQGKLNLIPARRNSDGEIGMYDTVTNTFFTNSGTGTFLAGYGIASTSYVQGMYEAIDNAKQDKLTASSIVTTGTSTGIVSSFTANNGMISVTRSEPVIPSGPEGSPTGYLPIWVE